MVAAMFPVSISQSRLTSRKPPPPASPAAPWRHEPPGRKRRQPAGYAGADELGTALSADGSLQGSADVIRHQRHEHRHVQRREATAVTIPGKVLSFNDIRLDDGTIAGNPRYRSNLWKRVQGQLHPAQRQSLRVGCAVPADVTYYNNTDAQIDVTSQAALNQLIAIQSPFAQVYFIPVAVRNRTLYDNTVSATNLDLQATNPNLQPRLVQVEIVPEPRAYGGYVLNMVRRTLGPPFPVETAVEGAYLVISDDRILFPRFLIRRPALPPTSMADG
jgi:hypothetical protein